MTNATASPTATSGATEPALVATAEQLRALVRTTKDRVVLVAARPVWEGSPELTVGPRTATVVAAGTVLGVRAAIADHRDAEVLVVLTDRSERELGLDVLSRVSRQRVRNLDPWELVRAELGVTALDPQLAGQRWILDALVQHKPADGWTKPASSVLQRDEAVRQLTERWLRWPAGSSLEDVLGWLVEAGNVDRLAGSSASIVAGVTGELERRFPGPARLLLDLAMRGGAGDLVPLGLAARVLWAGSTDAALIEARVRFEPKVGGARLEAPAALAWAAAAEALVRDRLAVAGRAGIDPWIARAEQAVRECGAQGWMAESDVLADSLDQRFRRAGLSLQAVLAGDGDRLADLERCLDAVARHLLAGVGDERLATLRSAVRLARRGSAVRNDVAGSLPALAVQYRDDGAWVDRARHAVRKGDRADELATAYSTLLARVDAERAEADRKFAEQLRLWSLGEPGDSTEIVPLERVLATVVAPLAATRPVLLVVADGMSWSVFGELADDLAQQGWLRLQQDRPMPIGVAALPTVTEASRASLLCGKLVSGTAPTELAGFPEVPALKALPGPAPMLFHKAQLSTAGGDVLAPELRAALLDTTSRVVGVVINSVDDHLNRGQQVGVSWTTSTMVPLRELLAEAAAADRTIVFTSDHGHVLDERRSVQRGIADPGERWRTAAAPPGDDEIVVTGPRVLLGGGTVVMPVSDTLRYGPPKHGYHGGATPQEVLVPVEVLARATSIPEGWGVADPRQPAWWTGGAAVVPPLPPVVSAPAVPARPTKGEMPGQAGLFGDAPVEAAPAAAGPSVVWIDALLASAAFAERRPLLARRRLEEAALVELLAALDRRGATTLDTVLAADLGQPVYRVQGLVDVAISVLNIEGYPVLERREATIALNLPLLRTQFGIGG